MLESVRMFTFHRIATTTNRIPKNDLIFDTDFERPTLQGATAPTHDTQGVASLALGYVLHWAFIDIIGCGSAIQASLIAFALHDDSARTC